MADKIAKFFRRIPADGRDRIMYVATRVMLGEIAGLDMKKLKGHDDLFRVRVGDYRLIFQNIGDKFILVDARKRDDQTYRDY